MKSKQHLLTLSLSLIALSTLTRMAVADCPPEVCPEEYLPSPQISAPKTPVAPATQVVPTVQIPPSTPTLTGKDYLLTSYKETTARGNYQGYEYLLQNKQPYHLEVLQADVINGQEEAVVAQEEAQKKRNGRRLFGGILSAAASAVPYAGYGSWGAYRAASIASNVAYTAGNAALNSASDAPMNMTNQYMKRFNGVIINPNQTFQFLTLTPKGTSPRIRVTFKNLETNQILDLEQ